MGKEMSPAALKLVNELSTLGLQDLSTNLDEVKEQIVDIAIQVGAKWPRDVIRACYEIGLHVSILQDEKYITSITRLPPAGDNKVTIVYNKGVKGGTNQDSDGHRYTYRK